MSFEKFWKRFEEQANPDKLNSAIDEQLDICRALGEKARAAEQAYYDDVAKKESVVSASVEKLEAQLSDIQKKVDELKQPLIEATTGEDSGLLSRIRSELKTFELQRAQIKSELELLQSTSVRGCEKLHGAVLKKNAEFEEARETLAGYANLVYGCKFAKSYESIEYRCKWLSSTSKYFMGTSAGEGADLDKLDRHCNPEKYAAIAAKELEARQAQAEAWERAKNGPVVISRPASALNPTAPGYDVY